MCKKKSEGNRCSGVRQATKAVSYVVAKITGADESYTRKAVNAHVRDEQRAGTSQEHVTSQEQDTFTNNLKEQIQMASMTRHDKRTANRRLAKSRLQRITYAMVAGYKRVLGCLTIGALAISLSSCSTPYTPEDAPVGVQATQSAPAETPAAEAPDVAATVAPGQAGYLTGTWADYKGEVAMGDDIVQTWGQERSDKAVNFALTALTDLYADDVYGPEAKTMNDFMTAKDYLSPEAYNSLSNSVSAAIAGDGEASTLVNSLYPQSNFSGEQTLSDNGTLLLTVEPGAVDYRLTNVSVGKWDVAEGQESMLTVKAYTTITYTGTTADGSAGTVVQERVQSLNLVPAGDSWQIASWGHTGTLVK